jgi:hypothetical protein
MLDSRAPSRLIHLHLLLLAAALLAPVRIANANPALETLGVGLHPFSSRIMATGAEAAYFSPALLPYIDEGLSLGFLLLSDDLDTTLMRRDPSADISSNVYKAWERGEDGSLVPLSFRPIPTANLRDRGNEANGGLRSYLTVGIAKRLLGQRLVLGLLAMLPTSTFQEQSAHFPDEREQFFSNSVSHELYGDRLGMMTIVVGLGGTITDWLSWGAGLTLGLSTSTVNPVYVPDAGDQSQILITTDTAVDTTFSPHLSVAVSPSDTVRFTASFHTTSKSETSGTNRLKFWNYDYPEGEDAVTQTFKFTNGYDPMTLALGASIAFPVDDKRAWRFGTEVRWRQWSGYVDRISKRPDVEWNDTLSVALGSRYETSGASFSLDIGWTPSPVPDQAGAENYVDEDRLGIAAGLEADIDILGTKLKGQIGVQVHRLMERETNKRTDAAFPVRDEFPDDAQDILTGQGFAEAAGLQTNNPGWPGWTSSGWILGAGVSLKVGL